MDAKPIVIWVTALVVVMTIVFAFHLPERMGCSGQGRSMSCAHGLLSPETWKQR